MSDIEKFSYLQSKLVRKVKEAVAGLEFSNRNYLVAIELLKERFGNKQEAINFHHNAFINFVAPSNRTESLRLFLDSVERHLRSLEVLGQDINQNVFISMIKSKQPQNTAANGVT